MSSYAPNPKKVREDQIEKNLSILINAINLILKGNFSCLRFEEVYRISYTLVTYKKEILLYDTVVDIISTHLDATRKSATFIYSIFYICDYYTTFKECSVMIQDMLMYLDKTFCAKNKRKNIYDKCMELFNEIIILNSADNDIDGADKNFTLVLYNQIFSLIEDDRNYNSTLIRQDENILPNRVKLKNIISMLLELDMFENIFQDQFLNSTGFYYNFVAKQLFEKNNEIFGYLANADDFYQNQKEFCEFCFPNDSFRDKIFDIFNSKFYVQFSDSILNDEKKNSLSKLLEYNTKNSNNDEFFSTLSLFYNSFKFSPETLLKDIGTVCYNKIIQMGTVGIGNNISNTNIDNKDGTESFKDIINFILLELEKFANILKFSFNNDKNIGIKIKEGFESFINIDYKVTLILAKYVNDQIFCNNSNASESEIDSLIDNVITIFRYLGDKDVFEEYLKLNLSSRLLNAAAISGEELEKRVISRFKIEAGNQFTSKLEKMLQDVQYSRDLMITYTKNCSTLFQKDNNSTNFFEITVTILTTGYWPTLPKDAFQNNPTIYYSLPKPCINRMDHFTCFYNSIFSGRRLHWQYNIGSAVLLCHFNDGKKHEFVVSTYQMIILSFFNQHDTLSWAAIKEKIGSTVENETEIANHLLSLAHPKIRVLLKYPSDKKLDDSNTFTYNSNYSNSLFKIKLPLLQKSKSSNPLLISQEMFSPKSLQDSTSIKIHGLSTVQEAREHQIDASIVRIMKSQRILNHNNLISEVNNQLSGKFRIEPIFIKKRIEILIDKEYLERDLKDRRVYHYLA